MIRSRSGAMCALRCSRSRAVSLQRLRQADDQRDIMRPGAQAVLLTAPRHPGQQNQILSPVQRADALGAVELVRAKRQKIDTEHTDIDRELAGGLDGVGMKRYAPLAAHGCKCGDRIEGADLVVGVDDGHDSRPG